MEEDLSSQAYFNRAQETCVNEALSFLEGFGEEEMRQFVTSTFQNAKAKGVNLDTAAREESTKIREYLENKIYRQNDLYNKLFNPTTGIYNEVLKKKISINDVLSKNTIKKKGANVETAQEAVQVNLRQQILLALSKGAQEIAMEGEYDYAVAQTVDTGSVPASVPDDIREHVKEIADTYKKLTEFLGPYELIHSTAFGVDDFNIQRFLKASYDPLKVTQYPSVLKAVKNFATSRKVRDVELEDSRKHFVNQMLKRANLELMFPTSADPEEVGARAFERQFDNIVSGQKVNLGANRSIKDTPEILNKKHMFVIWKDLTNYLDHQKEFGNGTGSLWESMNSEIQSIGKKAGMAQILGADPDWSFTQLRKAHLRVHGNLPRFNNPSHIFAELNGSVNIPYRPFIAQMQANFNAWTGMMKQFMIAPITLNDTNFGLQTINELTDNPYWQDMATKIKFISDAYKYQMTGVERDELRLMATNMYHSMQFEHGTHTRFLDSQDMGDMTRKVASKFYSYNGMKGKDFGNRAGAMFLVSKILTDSKGYSFENLSDGLQRRLKAFEVSPAEWNVWRKNMNGYAGEHNLTSIDDINNIPDDQIAALAKKLNLSAYQTRQNLLTKAYGWLQTAADETVLTPGAMERAAFNRGTQAGTMWGMAARSVAQFKGFMMSYVNRILINGYTQDSAKMKWRWAMSNFIYALPTTLMGNWMYSLGKGQEPNFNPEDWTTDDWANAFMPPLALFTKTLDPRNQNSNLLMNLIQSPSIRTMSDLLALGGSAVNIARPSTGDFDERLGRLGKKAGTIAYDTTPVNSVPYLSGWWHQHAM